jgi:hypothetical protein
MSAFGDLFDVLSGRGRDSGSGGGFFATAEDEELLFRQFTSDDDQAMRAVSVEPVHDSATPMSDQLPDVKQLLQCDDASASTTSLLSSKAAAPLIAPSAASTSSSNVIPTLAGARDAQFRHVSELVAEQRHAIRCADAGALQALAQREAVLSAQIAAQLERLRQLDATVVIEPAQLGAWQFLCSDLSLQLQQVQLLEDELRAIAANQSCSALMALVIQSQPFPSVVAKGRQLVDSDCIVVQLLCASTATAVAELSPVVASLVLHSVDKPGAGATTLVSGVVPSPLPAPQASYAAQSAQYLTDHVVALDAATLMARLPLKFASGTRKSLGSVRCAIHVRAIDGTTILCESNSSDATIVTTNDSQWAAADGSLLQWDLFHGTDSTTPWPRVVNALQRYFMAACRAHVPKNGTARVLSPLDVSYIHVRFFAAQQRANANQVSAFWAWFGTTLSALRFQRPLGALWHGGLLYGLLTRHDVEQALGGQAEGVFVLRFSETNPGQLGVAYVGADVAAGSTRVRHYLITAADVLGNKRTVCDFLMEQQQFQTLLVYSVDAAGQPTFTPVAKRAAFREFVKSSRALRDSDDAPDGYEPLN